MFQCLSVVPPRRALLSARSPPYVAWGRDDNLRVDVLAFEENDEQIRDIELWTESARWELINMTARVMRTKNCAGLI